MRRKILFIIGLILYVVPFLINTYSLIRLLAISIGIILLVLSIVLEEKRKLFLVVLTPFLLIIGSYGLDSILFIKFNRIPIFSYEMKSSEKVSTYNSFFYRAFDCDGKLILDKGYNKSYACGENDLEIIEINTLLADPVESYKKYDNKFIKVKGKVSLISGIDTIELKAYENLEETVNGNVKFKEGAKLKIETDTNLSDYRIYDEIYVIGLVEYITKEEDNIVIVLSDTMLLSNDAYKSYTIEVINNETKELKDFVKDKNYYLYGIDNIFVKYANESIYELSYAITDSRITIDNLLKDEEVKEIKDEEENIIARIYELDKFKIYVCEKVDKTYFTNKKLKFNEELCK